MKYTNEVEIELPVDEVIAKFDDLDGLKHWMRGLQAFDPIEGTPGEIGAKSRMKFKTGKRQFEMIETILAKNLPEEFRGSYDAPGVYNIIKNSFIPLDENRTKYVSESEFQFKNLGMKFFAWIMPNAFKKQSMIYLDDFKQYAEKGISVYDSNQL